MEKQKKREWLRNGLLMHLGVLLLAVGVRFFKATNGFATGGVSGLSILLYRLFPVLTQAAYMTAINVLLLLIGFLVLGRECGFKTVYCSLLFSGLNWLFEWLVPLSGPLTDQPFLELVYAILLTGIGSALLFQCGASSGGTDIVALILKKCTRLNVGRALLISDSLIAVSTFFVAGVQAGLYSVLGLFAKAFLVDGVIESLNTYKAFSIITSTPDPIAEYIMHTLHRGVTAAEATGEYTGEHKTVLTVVCRRADAVRLRLRIKELDPAAFVIVTNTSEIIGRGFRGV